jgi:hypothetical protein
MLSVDLAFVLNIWVLWKNIVFRQLKNKKDKIEIKINVFTNFVFIILLKNSDNIVNSAIVYMCNNDKLFMLCEANILAIKFTMTLNIK